jgi:hypothetical protein
MSFKPEVIADASGKWVRQRAALRDPRGSRGERPRPVMSGSRSRRPASSKATIRLTTAISTDGSKASCQRNDVGDNEYGLTTIPRLAACLAGFFASGLALYSFDLGC